MQVKKFQNDENLKKCVFLGKQLSENSTKTFFVKKSLIL